MKTALLSNVNIDPLTRMLEADTEVFPGEGFGDVMGPMLNPSSSLHAYGPDVVFILCDLSLLTQACADESAREAAVADWFQTLASCIQSGKTYFISDADFRTPDIRIGAVDSDSARRCEAFYGNLLDELVKNHANAHIFPYKQIAQTLGRNAFYAPKLWYLGKVIHAPQGLKALAAQVKDCLRMLTAPAKKALVLDLDDTLWGGVVGEAGLDGVTLSEEGVGMAYKDAQRVLLRMRQAGVLLCIASKNNEADAWETIENHPQMLLKKDDFAAARINWQPKYESIKELAGELNIGLDSLVFIDDNPTEREAVRTFLPEVTTPEFPAEPDKLPAFFAGVYADYFQQLSLTGEDRRKTQQYQENADRSKAERAAADFPSFLRGLGLQLTAFVPEEQHLDRFAQLIEKTNQFNLTTVRHSRNALREMMASEAYACYLFSLRDKFGDYGIVGAAIADMREETPFMDSFVLSCRAMGKLVEAAMLDYVERDLAESGYDTLRARLNKTAKNTPAQGFYAGLGYEETNSGGDSVEYRISLEQRPEREYYIEVE